MTHARKSRNVVRDRLLQVTGGGESGSQRRKLDLAPNYDAAQAAPLPERPAVTLPTQARITQASAIQTSAAQNRPESGAVAQTHSTRTHSTGMLSARVLKDRLIKVTGSGEFNPLPRQPDPAPKQNAKQSGELPRLRPGQALGQPTLLRSPTSLRSTTATGTRLKLPGELPERLREVDLKLAAERAHILDAEEIAAYLEADGLGDEVLRDRYGTDGLFDAAEMLYRQNGTGRALNRLSAPSTPAFPWKKLLRGPLYLLPGLVGLLIASALGSGAESAFVLAAAFGWGWTMLVAGVRYAEPFAVPGRALRLTLLLSGVAGVLGGALIAGLLGGTGLGATQAVLTGALMGGAVALASGAAGILLSLGQMGQFAGAFASPLLIAGIVMTLPSRGAALCALALLAAVPTVTALNATRAPGSLSASWQTLRPHLPHALYGWGMAAAFVALSARLGTWALLPIILGAGLLEAGVWHAQERLQVAARSSRDLLALRRVGLPTVLLSAAGYGLALGAGLLLLAWLPLPINLPDNLSAALLATVFYSAALLLSSWLANQRRTALLTAVWMLGAAALLLGLSPPLFGLLMLLALLFPTLDTLSDPRSYR